jgi:hypothetical protein
MSWFWFANIPVEHVVCSRSINIGLPKAPTEYSTSIAKASRQEHCGSLRSCSHMWVNGGTSLVMLDQTKSSSMMS